MRILIDIVHPADVLFFKRPIDDFLARGDELLVLSRHKDITCSLLDNLGVVHRSISRAGNGKMALLRELLLRDREIFRATRRFEPQVMLGFGGVSISHVTQLTGVPSVAFYDSENAKLQTSITWPFISHLYVPLSYRGPIPHNRTTRLPGTKDLSYLHPSAFRPDFEMALAAGLCAKRKNFFIRVVEWRANHDLGKSGWTPKALVALVNWLAQKGKVHLSAEREIPEELKVFRYSGDLESVHHLIAHCDLLVGESATMASEAAILGVPGIYAGRDFPCYTRELADFDLIECIAENDTTDLIDVAAKVFKKDRQVIKEKRDNYIAGCPDWGKEVVEAAYRHAIGRGL